MPCSGGPPASASRVAGITCLYYKAQLYNAFFLMKEIYISRMLKYIVLKRNSQFIYVKSINDVII